ncbi:uncharacterized protein LOC121367529 isoform X2 [Gigantopelta aegis]|uniref:uncharacterized protein LOC121367529 isoform X2 n=1 Tax=Gigantopelta aegis TaxID=1735272 RepID=UPI001B887E36|nr:uncharacterized protein LOC121367529 isoform X2 [Gigantopelta aegis]
MGQKGCGSISIMKIEIILLCACVVMTSATYIYHDRYPIDQYQQHYNQFPVSIGDGYIFPYNRGGNTGRRYKRGIYNFQYNRLRHQIKDNGLGHWAAQGFSTYGTSNFGRLGNLAATLSSGRYW